MGPTSGFVKTLPEKTGHHQPFGHQRFMTFVILW